MEQKHQEQLEEQHRIQQEEEEEEEVLRGQEQELKLETQRMVERGHQEKVKRVDPQDASGSELVSLTFKRDWNGFRFTADLDQPGREPSVPVGWMSHAHICTLVQSRFEVSGKIPARGPGALQESHRTDLICTCVYFLSKTCTFVNKSQSKKRIQLGFS